MMRSLTTNRQLSNGRTLASGRAVTSGRSLSVTVAVVVGVNALVSGAGTAEINGTYTPRGTSGGKIYYNLEGQPDDETGLAISWNLFGIQWEIYTSDGSLAYSAKEDVENPWEVSEWTTNGDVADSPAPTVTQT